jgi:ribose transport system permease protein
MNKAIRQIGQRPYGLAVVAALVLLIANIVARSSFAAVGSWSADLADFAPFALAAMASTPQILGGGGGIDISIGPILNFVSVFIVAVCIPHGLGGPVPSIAIALGIGIGIGVINGLLVTVMRYQPVLATLCTLFVLEGVSMAVLSTPRSTNLGWVSHLGNRVGPIPGGLILILSPLVIWFALRRTTYVKTLFAVGGNDVTTFSAGVNVKAVRIIAYALGGAFAALAGLALLGVTQAADPTQSTQYTLPAVAAVAIGGTSLLGGRGSLGGSVAGAAVMFLIQTLLDSLAVSDLWLQLVYGVLLLVAIVIGSAVHFTPTAPAEVT